jgi:hypothetical protein
MLRLLRVWKNRRWCRPAERGAERRCVLASHVIHACLLAKGRVIVAEALPHGREGVTVGSIGQLSSTLSRCLCGKCRMTERWAIQVFFCFKTLGRTEACQSIWFNKDWEISLAIASAELDCESHYYVHLATTT